MVFKEKSISIETEINAKKETYAGERAWEVVAGANKVYVAGGKKIIEFDPATANKDEMLRIITGRSGNLRAPALKWGTDFYIGFNADMYERIG